MSLNAARIGLAAALLVAAAGIAFPFVVKSELPRPGVKSAAPASAYVAVSVPSAPALGETWRKPVFHEDELWRFDLFTPIQIKWNAAGGVYVPKGYIEDNTLFGLNLVELRHPQYRYRLIALVQVPSGKKAETSISINDSVARTQYRGTIGGTFGKAPHTFQILDYKNDVVNRPDGSIAREPSVRIADAALGREMDIREKTLFLTDKIDAVFAEDSDPAPVWTAHAVDDKFENAAGVYIIKGIDFEAQSVTVEKTWMATAPKPLSRTVTADLQLTRPKTKTPSLDSPKAPPAGK